MQETMTRYKSLHIFVREKYWL